MIIYDLRYYGYLEDNIRYRLKSFKVVVFKVRWYIFLLQGDERIIIHHENGFTMMDSKGLDTNFDLDE